MGKIVAIGGGEIKDRETEKIDRQILELTGKSKPKILFIPTASSDAEGYWTTFRDYFSSMGAIPSVLKLVENAPTRTEIENTILSSDAVYVGGGNTRKMLDIWKEKGVDQILRSAYEKGIVLSGLSAGAICWFEFGSSDSPAFDNPEDKKLILLPALGFVKGLFSPHHIREPFRNDQLPQILKQAEGTTAFAADDKSALVIIDGKAHVVNSSEASGIKAVSLKNGEIKRTQIPINKEFKYEDLLNPELNFNKSGSEVKKS
jgi:dipeptidase E